jgi:hypothetical protein
MSSFLDTDSQSHSLRWLRKARHSLRTHYLPAFSHAELSPGCQRQYRACLMLALSMRCMAARILSSLCRWVLPREGVVEVGVDADRAPDFHDA